MNGATPTFFLPQCPKCSHGKSDIRPAWHYAHHTSAREGRGFYIWIGCPHAQALRTTFPVGEVAEWNKTEAAWRELVPKLFEERCGTWPAERRRVFARSIGADFPPDPPAQPETQNTEKHG